jgi:acyl-CoA thioesterase I
MRFPLPLLLAAPLATFLLATSLLASTPAAASGDDCPWAPTQRLSLPASRAALAASEPLDIVAIGSSSTEGVGASTPEQSYPARLHARLSKALAGVVVRVRNLGHGGETAAEMLARLRHDVLERPATLVIWQAGTNDALRQRDPEAFRAEMEAGLEELEDSGMDVVLMDSQRAPRLLDTSGYERFDETLRELAASHKLSLFSRASLMRHWLRDGVPFEAMIGKDGLHHNDRGYDCVAKALARSILAALRPTQVVAGR